MGVLGSFWTHHKHGYWLGYLAIFILDPHDSQWLYGPYGVLMARAGLSRSGRRAPRRQTTPDREHFATFPKGDSARSHPTLAAGLAPLRVPGL